MTETQTRRLAAILAADVVGYSRLMGADEAGVLAALRALRAELFDPMVERHKGRIVKLMGDGALVEFASVVDAVTCAVEVQKALAARNADLPEDRRLELRIGVNLGDVMVEGDDLYGDGVNIAARLEGLAEPGGIRVSEAVAKQVSGKVPMAFVDRGEHSLKNIVEPVRVFSVETAGPTTSGRRPGWRRVATVAAGAAALAVAVIAVWTLVGPPGPADVEAFDAASVLDRPTGPTLAVMPFRNLSGDPAHVYLSDGVSEDIITELGRFPEFNVLSSRTTSAYRDQAMGARDVGRALGADFIIDGSVRRADERLRVNVQLVDARSRAQVWSDSYDETLSARSLFDVQILITERVVAAIADSDGAIKRIDARRARTKPPEKLSSYECSMVRNDLFDGRAEQKRVRGCILRVVQEEPDYWQGWAQLANALRIDVMLFTKLYEGTNAEKLDRALDAARKAVELNPEAPRAHHVLADVLLLRGDREAFYAAAEDALALGGARDIEGQLGYWFVWTGRYELGAALLRRAIDLNPKSADESWHHGLADYHFDRGDYEAALAAYRRGAQPDYWWAVAQELAILVKLGREDEARAARDRLLALRPDIKIADIVWLFRRFQRPDAASAKYVEAFREAGIPEGRYRPLDLDDRGSG